LVNDFFGFRTNINVFLFFSIRGFGFRLKGNVTPVDIGLQKSSNLLTEGV
jgi:hypothetical protein